MSQRVADSFDWEECGPEPVHPIKVVIIEALLWIDEPLSAKTVELIMDGSASLPLIAYHLRKLAAAAVVEKAGLVVVGPAVQTFYRLSS